MNILLLCVGRSAYASRERERERELGYCSCGKNKTKKYRVGYSLQFGENDRSSHFLF